MPLVVIKQEFILRIAYSNRLLEFIDRAELKTISKKELDVFCLDIFSEIIPDPISLLVKLKGVIKNSITGYEKMVALCEAQDKPFSMSVLDLYLEHDGLVFEKVIKISQSKNPDFSKPARYLVDEIDFLKSLRDILKPHWPAELTFFRKHFHFQLINSQFRNFKNHRPGPSQYQLNMAFDEGKCNTQASNFVLSGLNIPVELAKVSDTTLWASQHYANQIKSIIDIPKTQFPELIGNVFGFYEVLIKLKSRADAIYKEIDLQAQQQEIQLNLIAYLDRVRPKLEKLAEQFENEKSAWCEFIKSIDNIRDDTLDLIYKKISISEKVLVSYFGKTEQAMSKITAPNCIPTAEKVNVFKVKSENTLIDIKKLVNQYHQLQTDYKQLENTISRQKLLQEMLEAQEQKQAYIVQKQSHLLLWKTKVEEGRKIREVCQLKFVSGPIEAVSQAETQAEQVFLNRVESLKHLSARHIALLKAIFCLEKGITYHQVYFLLTNQLGAKIVENGNGSSHKTIIMNNLSTCLVTSNQLPDVVKGGIFKPHGGAHQSGELCGFNLELIQTVLEKAGITPEVIEVLEKQKLSNKLALMNI